VSHINTTNLAVFKHDWLLKLGPIRLCVPQRVVKVNLCLMAGLIAVTIGSLVLGEFDISAIETVKALFGVGERSHLILINDIRLPRVITGLITGFGLGLAGTMIQTLARNRLATPEVLGINEGATLAIIVIITVSTSNLFGVWWVAPIGSAITAAVLILLGGGRVGTQGYRLLIIGLGLTALLRSVNELIISRQNLMHASALYTWTLGSLATGNEKVNIPVGTGILLVLPVCLICTRWLNLMRFDEEVAIPLGLPRRGARLLVIGCVVVMAGLSVGAAGPIAFVALAAPILASRLLGASHVPMLTSAWTGCVLVLAADTLGRLIAYPNELPVGVVCSVLGGPFLLWVVLRQQVSR
jgi:iron complex transport system permease protein